jgi:putative tricarboxylic transport membrane protein
MLENLMIGLSNSTSLLGILGIFIGVLWGIIGGAIPGISGSIAMALILPLTYGLDPLIALPTLAAVYVGAEFGGSIPAILIGAPGTGGAAATVLDGHELHKQGKGGLALFTSLFSGVIGGITGALLLMLFVIPLAKFGLQFGPAEYFLLAMFGLTIIGTLSGENQLKGLTSAALGLLIATIGLDPFTGSQRFTFGSYLLYEGIALIPLMVGLFALSEIFMQIYKKETITEKTSKFKMQFLSISQAKIFAPIAVICGVIGTILGAMPGAGGSIAAWVSYSEVKRWSRDKTRFGKGELKGVVAPESSNNAVPSGALVPLLALGIPGSNSTAILLGAFMIHGLVPGPLLFQESPGIPFTIIVSMIFAQIFLLFIGLLLIKPAVTVTSLSKKYLYTTIIALVFIGSFSTTNNISYIAVALIFGVVGFFMKKYGFAPAAAVLGFVLGPLFENNFRRALSASQGYYNIFYSSTISKVLIVLIIFSLLFPLISNYINKRKMKKYATQE